jgi:DNA-binding winged helix-turn-helix (wHTH) protein
LPAISLPLLQTLFENDSESLKKYLKFFQKFSKTHPVAMDKRVNQIYEFADFRLDKSERQLLREGKPLSLTPRVFDLLVVLVEHQGSLVTKDELMQQVWADSFVEEANLNVNISTLRKALGQNSFIETVPKKGYRFLPNVREVNHPETVFEKYTKTLIVAEEEEETSENSSSAQLLLLKSKKML